MEILLGWDEPLFLSQSFNKATKAQTLKFPHPFLFSHTHVRTHAKHQCVALPRGKREKEETFPGEWCVRGRTCIHTASTTLDSSHVQSINKADEDVRLTPPTPPFPYFSADYYNSMIINTTRVKLDRPNVFVKEVPFFFFYWDSIICLNI